ncbi:MAG TPA: type II CAAX endopeptidase family protein [Terriglobales bacterium]|nr:type II CAAX endopeptidase family protein [Terriglobales bacterium]
MHLKSTSDETTTEIHHHRRQSPIPVAAVLLYGLALVAFWFAAQHFNMEERIGGHLPSTFASFALLFTPYWFFGFGLDETLRHRLFSPASRVLAPAVLLIPYLIFALPRGEFRFFYAVILVAIPVGLAALFEFVPPQSNRLAWQDVVALVVVGFPVEFRLLAGSWPHSGLSALPKILLVDSALYVFLVLRRLEGVGFDFRPRLRDLAIGLREWTFYAPIAIGLGLALGFIRFHAGWPPLSKALSALLITFFFVAIPEELFFRGLLQNLLEARIGRANAWVTASVIFGLSHFNKPLPFNWRYVLLATIAGLFYGRAWRDRRRLLTSGTTHTLVDVVWSLWFR